VQRLRSKRNNQRFFQIGYVRPRLCMSAALFMSYSLVRLDEV
jgi:hypothetical protein